MIKKSKRRIGKENKNEGNKMVRKKHLKNQALVKTHEFNVA